MRPWESIPSWPVPLWPGSKEIHVSVSRLRLPSPPLASLVLALAACSDSSPSSDLGDLDLWVAENDLRVGSLDDPDYSLTWFRSLTVSESGRIYTAHGQEQLVRVFDPDGTLLRVIGGRGDGPGEFQNVGSMGWVGDTLWVLDFGVYRFNLFSEEGDFLSSFSVPFGFQEGPDAPQPPRAAGLLSDGRVHGAPPAFSSQIESGTLTHHKILLLSREGEVTDSVASVPFGKNQWAVYDADNPRAGMLFGRQPYADGPLWGFLPHEPALVVLFREAPASAEEARFTLMKLGLFGDTVFAREYPFHPSPVTASEVDSILEAQTTQWSEYGVMGGVTAARLRSWAQRTLYRPAFRPGVTEMVVGMDGGLWLRGQPDGGGQVEWYVLDPLGNPAKRVTLPSGVTVLAADQETAWGMEQDELDVPYVVRYRIRPRGG